MISNHVIFKLEIEDGKLKIEVKNCELDTLIEGESKTLAVSMNTHFITRLCNIQQL